MAADRLPHGQSAIIILAWQHEVKCQYAMDRTFTLEEAQQLVPVLESLLRRAVAEKEKVEAIAQEFQQLAGHVFAAGGCELDIVALSRRKAERDLSVQHLKDTVEEITAMGVQIKDLEMGLLDFPCIVDGETILLCWKLGEERIGHWHGLEEGYKGRKPITDKIAGSKPPEKPN